MAQRVRPIGFMDGPLSPIDSTRVPRARFGSVRRLIGYFWRCVAYSRHNVPHNDGKHKRRCSLLTCATGERMRAITLPPGVPDSARLDEVPEPAASDGAILVRSLALGVCGTDAEIVRGEYGWAPPGSERLVLGHESLGEVISA